MAAKYICSVCELPEERCDCERYCCSCKSGYDIRLCEDGQYYCQPCREACELEAQI